MDDGGGEDKLTACLKHAATSILSVGSGDGSQQLAIVREGHTNICSTFYDSKDVVLKKYPHAVDILHELQSKCKYPPMFGVDATKLEEYKAALGTSFDLVFFTFPHTGVPNDRPESVTSNQELLRGFLTSVHHVMAPGGQVQLTLKSGQHYDRWNWQSLIKDETGLRYDGCSKLRKDLFPGYHHRLTNGMSGKLKEVPDKLGATVHRFRCPSVSPADDKDERPAHLTRIDIIAMHPQHDGEEDECGGCTDRRKRKTSDEDIPAAPTDERIRERILSYLEDDRTDPSAATIPVTVLEIRRGAFGGESTGRSAVPPVPQLNLVLYQLMDEKVLKQLPCRGARKKPRWELLR